MPQEISSSITLVDYKCFSERENVQRSTEYYIIFLSKQLFNPDNDDRKTNISLDLSIDVKYTKSNHGLCHHFQPSNTSSEDLSKYLKINCIPDENKQFIFVQISENLTHRISSINILHQSAAVKHLETINILRPSHIFFNDKILEIFESIVKQIVLKKLDSSSKVYSLHAVNSNKIPKGVEAIFTHFGDSLFFQKDDVHHELPYHLEIFSDPTPDSSENDFNALFKPFEKLTIHDKPSSPDQKAKKTNLNSEEKSERKSELSTNQSTDSTNLLSPRKEEVSSMQSLDLMNISTDIKNSPSQEVVYKPPLLETNQKSKMQSLETVKIHSIDFSSSKEDQSKVQNIGNSSQVEECKTETANAENEDSNANTLSLTKIDELLLVEQRGYNRKQTLIKDIRYPPVINNKFIPIGLPRVRNLCYMNSVLQVLLNTPLFTNFFLSGAKPLGFKTLESLAYNFGYLAQVIQSYYVNPYYSQYCWQNIISWTHSLRMSVAQKNSSFLGLEQQDAYEFLMTFLECVSQDLNNGDKESKYRQIEPSTGKEGLQQQSSLHFQNMLERENSIVTDLFCGQLAIKLKCLDCKEEKVTFESYWALSLAIKEKSHTAPTLEQLLSNFFKEETCHDTDPICKTCKHNTTTTSRSMIWRLPEILIITFKRFQGSFQGYEKDYTTLRYPIKFNISQFCEGSEDISIKDSHYTLFGMINHTGTLKTGHYTAACRNIYNQKWYRFDDDDVRELHLDQHKNDAYSSPYILFYVRSSNTESQMKT